MERAGLHVMFYYYSSMLCTLGKTNDERNLWCLEKISILPLVISATGIVPQSLFKNLKILDLDNTLVVEIQKGILLYSCHIVRKFLNIDTEHNTQQSQNVEARRR
jgi:uncharacterized protein with NAD-binding domain and iron-sulfur cluster